MKLKELPDYVNFKYGIFIIIYEPDNLFLLLLDVKTIKLPLGRGKKLLLKKLQSRSKKWKNDGRLPQAWGQVFLLHDFKKIFLSFLYTACNIIRQHLQENIKQHLPIRKIQSTGLSSQSLLHSSSWIWCVLWNTESHTCTIKSCISYVKWCRVI